MTKEVYVLLEELNRIIANRQADVPAYLSSDVVWIQTPYIRFVAARSS